MKFLFPEVEDVPLKNSPLNEVVCQIKFPPILKIGQNLPVDFHEQIRDKYPNFDIEQGFRINVGSQEVKFPSESSTQSFRFKSEDNETMITLSVNFLSLSTKKYQHWKDFSENFNYVLNILENLFNPVYSTRIGLRFINEFSFQKKKQSENVDLLKLFREELVCLITNNELQNITSFLSQSIVSDKEITLAIRNKFESGDSSQNFVLDFDCYCDQRKPINEISDLVEEFHNIIYRAFRWSLKESSMQYFNPK